MAQYAHIAWLIVSRVRGLATPNADATEYTISAQQLDAIVEEYSRPGRADNGPPFQDPTG